MADEKEIERRGHIVGFREAIANAANCSDDDFFTWFNDATDKEAAFVRGSWDFMLHIAQPASRFLSKPEEKVALEIGYGGGRILAAASRCFGKVIGVDVHENNDKVERELKKRGANNFELIKTDGSELPLGDDAVDFVYSFIVLQHIEKYQIFKRYFQEIYRVLRPNGLAVLYFGRKYFFSMNSNSRCLYLIDRIAEGFLLSKGFQELPARVNCTNLIVSLSHAKRLSKSIGFEILGDLVSHKKVPDGLSLFGGQNGLVMRKR